MINLSTVHLEKSQTHVKYLHIIVFVWNIY